MHKHNIFGTDIVNLPRSDFVHDTINTYTGRDTTPSLPILFDIAIIGMGGWVSYPVIDMLYLQLLISIVTEERNGDSVFVLEVSFLIYHILPTVY